MAQSSLSNATISAISWGAILAGAVIACALSLVLFLLGTGLGLSSISPWSHHGIEASTFGLSAIVWITVTQLIAAGMGGYLTGRLRVKWADAPADEVYFRDTAHGFLAWSVATLATAALLTTTVGAIVNSGVQAASHVVGGAVQAVAMTSNGSPGAKPDRASHKKQDTAYFIDALFRKNTDSHAAATIEQAPPSAEVTRIFAHANALQSLPDDDARYLAQLISTHTGLAEQEAGKRVNEIYAAMQSAAKEADTKAAEVADKARKASVYMTLWLFVSLLIGAFSASLAATWGGRCRDA
ncbi:membrane protein [Methylophilus sp. 5]|uniref:membrane protein n=1 Tax=Methylophilus sp. 5 TaxID=1112274 RepID=UPI00048D3ADD|nr:membrane protein [Methylophilus sp. 5]